MARYAIYSNNTGTTTARPVLGVLEIPNDPAGTFALRLAAQTALLNANEAMIELASSAAITDLDSDVNTQDFTVDPTATPPVALTALTVARFTLQQRQAQFRAKREALIAEALPFATPGFLAQDSAFEQWLEYVAELRALPDDPADPDSVTFPSAPSSQPSAPSALPGGTTMFQRLYRRGNVIGAVNQLLGTPTGALMEKGSNANGWYRRYACGLQICGAEISAAAQANIAAGQIFRSDEATWTFPAAFTDTVIAVRCDPLTTGTQWGKGRRTSTTQAAYQVMSATSSGSAVAASLTAIGQWF